MAESPVTEKSAQSKPRFHKPTLGEYLDGKRPIPPDLIPDDQKMREFAHRGDLILKVLALFEQGEISTLSEAAEVLNVSKYTLWKLKRSDPEFAQELDIALNSMPNLSSPSQI